MPRRKQDRPQHLEENMKIDQLINGAVRDCVESMQSERQLDHDFKEPLITNMKICNGLKDSPVDDLPCITSQHASTDVETVRPASISNEEWSDVQSTLRSIQQQLEVLRLQQFQFMKLLASQNENSKAHGSSDCDSLPVTTTSQVTRPQLEKLSNPSSCEVLVADEPSVSAEKELQDKQLVADEEEKNLIEINNTESENAFDLELGSTPENEEEGEPASFDCTKCSAVLPSESLLQLHMYSHERRETTTDQLSSPNRNDDSMPNVSAAAQGPSSFGSLPPSYQSIINDLSNDSLEEYMEIQKPENTHLEHLVKNMDGTVTDPNQCLICKRILSCKSALMMHYRTHTGERPFKCKLCSRAFTTKGNLKTHMGVHRAKPPLRLLHNCVICNKQFTNALVLNQHMKMHSDESSRKRNFDVQSSIASEECKRQRLSMNSESSFKDEPMENAFDLVKKGLPVPEFHPLSSVASASNPGFPFDFGGIPSIPDPLRYAEIFARQWEQFNQYSMFNPITSVKPPIFSGPLGLHGPSGLGLPFPLGGTLPPNSLPSGKPTFSSNAAIDDFMHPSAKQRQQEVETEDKLSELSQNERATADSVRLSNNSPKSEQSWGSSDAMSGNNGGMRLDPPPGTTCDICLKTFACRSALEIHYRSHTKHRPFKCDMCDKAFTTRGNMKQHILTHKSDDMQWGAEKQITQPPVPSPPNTEVVLNNDDQKKTSGRHQCSICLKYFSSASAVQIHFRTHTGDRPFKCHICSKAFTTKGNLKVHMGTHIWNGSAPVNSGRLDIGDGSEPKLEQREEEVVPVTSPSRSGIMNNNNLGWNPFNHSPLVKPFMNGHQSIMGSYPNMFLPPGGLQPPTSEESKPWSWQLTCHLCNKELPSHVALELHMKTHIVNETSASKAVPAT